jgi:phage baseplate assembly protein W
MSDVTLPRPNETTYCLMLLVDSTPEEARRYAIEDVVKTVLERWKPGWDLSIVIRQPSEYERWQMLNHMEADDG